MMLPVYLLLARHSRAGASTLVRRARRVEFCATMASATLGLSPLECVAAQLSTPSTNDSAMDMLTSPDSAHISHTKPNLVIVVGTTGTGKSKLAIDIALACNGEIVNSDSVQMYKGLDIASAKVTEAEKQGIPHHLFSFLLPRQVFTVRDYQAMARIVIDDIVSRGKLPVVVGGTMYYVQSLIREGGVLDNQDIDDAASDHGDTDAASGMHQQHLSAEITLDARCDASSPAAPVSSVPGVETPYQRLQRVDPIMAGRLHPNDHRKIARALEVYDSSGGVPYSSVLRKQAERIAGGQGPHRAKMFNLQVADRTELYQRLDARVQRMLDRGLIGEQRVLRAYLQSAASHEVSSVGTAPSSSASPAITSLTQDEPSELTLRALRQHLESSGRTLTAPPSPRGAESRSSAAASSSADAVDALEDHDSDAEVTGGGSASAVGGGTPTRGTGADRSEYAGLLQAIGYKEFEEYLCLAEKIPSASPGIHAATPVSIGRANNDSDRSSGRRQDLKRPRSPQHQQSADTSAAVSTDTAAAQQPRSDLPVGHRSSSNGKRKQKSSSDPVEAALQIAIKKLRDVTHSYARKQLTWIRNRFQKRGVPIVTIDTGGAAAIDDAVWKATVAGPAIEGVKAWLASSGEDADGAPASSSASAAAAAASSTSTVVLAAPEVDRITAWKQYTCTTCDGKLLNGDMEWQQHLSCKSHRRRVAHVARQKELKAFLEARAAAASEGASAGAANAPDVESAGTRAAHDRQR